jgi:hypothetical protein
MPALTSPRSYLTIRLVLQLVVCLFSVKFKFKRFGLYLLPSYSLNTPSSMSRNDMRQPTRA